ncbi:hypothetical protein [Streptomyces sp. NPDC127114]|uniref:hypothetical protein n=1 Tax=Streptomyces sp. NPDC127114 TaxID=3345366 RepID=UPI003635029E
MTSGPVANTLSTYDFDGRLRRTLTTQQGASGLVLSEDGKTLYVALAAGDAISAIDTETFTERTRYATGAHTCPAHLTRIGADIWFGYGCDAWAGAVGRLDTSQEPAKVSLDAQVPPDQIKEDPKRFERPPLLETGGTVTRTLVASQPHISPVNVRVYTVKDGALVPGVRDDRGGSNLTDLAVSPDGATLFTAAGSQDHIEGFATSDLSGKGAWFTEQAPTALAAAPDGTYLANGTRTARSDGATVVLEPLVAGVEAISYRLPKGKRLADRGLAWSADGTALAIIAQDGKDAGPAVYVVRPGEAERGGVG